MGLPVTRWRPGWAPFARQVDLTGKTVSPKVYIAAGVSGKIQHLAGMITSEYIIAIKAALSAAFESFLEDISASQDFYHENYSRPSEEESRRLTALAWEKTGGMAKGFYKKTKSI